MDSIFQRTELLLGKEAMIKLNNSHVAVFGAGGVGGYAFEALVRSGVGKIDIVDKDVIDITNLNRQIIALRNNVGEDKCTVCVKRAKLINENVVVNARKCFFLPENAEEFDFSQYDFVLDAIDNVTAKIELIMRCSDAGTPIISCMGTGRKLDPSRLRISDIYETSVCPLARVMRKELKNRGIKKLPVVWSDEIPRTTADGGIIGSTAFVPGSAGLLMASYVIRRLIENVD